jgi:hypothetical protein
MKGNYADLEGCAIFTEENGGDGDVFGRRALGDGVFVAGFLRN